MFRDNFDIQVPIKEDLKKGLIFGFNSRLPVGEVMGFFGYSDEACYIMQSLSHSTRAYLWNENGLQGFLVAPELLVLLQVADECEALEDVTKY